MMRGVTSVLRTPKGEVVLRVYLNDGGPSEYYELTLSTMRARTIAADLLVAANTADHYAGGLGGRHSED